MNSRIVPGALVVWGLVSGLAEVRAEGPAPGTVSLGQLRYVTLVVQDQDEALRWYTEKLGFAKFADQSSPNGDRWLVVAPPGQKNLGIILYSNSMKRLDAATYQRRIGGETLWVFETDDAKSTCAAMKQRGVKFVNELEEQPWGAQAIIADLYGNEFVIVQPKAK